MHKQAEPFSCTLYHNLTEAFVADNFDLLSSLLSNEQNTAQFSSDGNLGLTKQVYESFFVCRIVTVSTIYSTITPDRVLRYVNKDIPLDEQRTYQTTAAIENKIRELFLQKRIYGYIEQENTQQQDTMTASSMIIFLNEKEGKERLCDERKSDSEMIAALQENMKSALSTYSSLQYLLQDAVQSPKLIGTVLNNHLSGGGAGGSIRNVGDFE
jgi:multidrug efflux pump subunit AcrB